LKRVEVEIGSLDKLSKGISCSLILGIQAINLYVNWARLTLSLFNFINQLLKVAIGQQLHSHKSFVNSTDIRVELISELLEVHANIMNSSTGFFFEFF